MRNKSREEATGQQTRSWLPLILASRIPHAPPLHKRPLNFPVGLSRGTPGLIAISLARFIPPMCAPHDGEFQAIELCGAHTSFRTHFFFFSFKISRSTNDYPPSVAQPLAFA